MARGHWLRRCRTGIFGEVSERRPLRAWWQEAGIDPVKAARKLWNDSRMDQGRIGPGPTAQRPAADRTTNPEQSWKMQLALDNHGIDDSGDVVDGRVVDELHDAGIEVDFNFGDVAASSMPSQ